MTKLIDAFAANATNADKAKRLLAYLDKHPMSICFATQEEQYWIEVARRIAR